MIQEILPAYGKVLIVDDQYKDVQLIQNILAQNGVPYIFMIIILSKILKCGRLKQ